MLIATSFRIMTKQKLINNDSSDPSLKISDPILLIQIYSFVPLHSICPKFSKRIPTLWLEDKMWLLKWKHFKNVQGPSSRIKKQGVVNGCARVGIKALYHKTYLCTLHFSSQRLFVRFLCVLFCSDFLRLGLSNP